MFNPPAIAREIARQRHRDFVARADRYRLSRRVSHPSTLSGWPRLRSALLRWRHLDDDMSLGDSEEGGIVAASPLTVHTYEPQSS